MVAFGGGQEFMAHGFRPIVNECLDRKRKCLPVDGGSRDRQKYGSQARNQAGYLHFFDTLLEFQRSPEAVLRILECVRTTNSSQPAEHQEFILYETVSVTGFSFRLFSYASLLPCCG
jgi:hypothetical protein